MSDSNQKPSDNILANLVGSIILQIKPYQPPQVSGNGKETQINAAAAKEEAPIAKKEALPRTGVFKWLQLRRKYNGEGAMQAKPAPMKK